MLLMFVVLPVEAHNYQSEIGELLCAVLSGSANWVLPPACWDKSSAAGVLLGWLR